MILDVNTCYYQPHNVNITHQVQFSSYSENGSGIPYSWWYSSSFLIVIKRKFFSVPM